MKTTLAVAAALLPVAAAVRSSRGGANQTGCLSQDLGLRALAQAKLSSFGVECEELCKRMNVYPNCQCPGFGSSAASEADVRSCMERYCQDPSTPCPTKSFVTCVKEVTKLDLMQWEALLQGFGASLGFGGKSADHRLSVPEGSSCQEEDRSHRAFIQAKLAVFGVECEDICRRMGVYPNCQCPGFAGNPASDGDTRACMDRYCQDPSTPCPTDAFVTCVREMTKGALLQWGPLLQRFDSYAKLWKQAQSGKLAVKKVQ